MIDQYIDRLDGLDRYIYIYILSCSNSRAKESSTFGPFHFHFNSVAALRVLLVRAKARWLIDVVSGVGGILLEHVCQKCVL